MVSLPSHRPVLTLQDPSPPPKKKVSSYHGKAKLYPFQHCQCRHLVTNLINAAVTKQWVAAALSAVGGFRTTSYNKSKTSPPNGDPKCHIVIINGKMMMIDHEHLQGNIWRSYEHVNQKEAGFAGNLLGIIHIANEKYWSISVLILSLWLAATLRFLARRVKDYIHTSIISIYKKNIIIYRQTDECGYCGVILNRKIFFGSSYQISSRQNHLTDPKQSALCSQITRPKRPKFVETWPFGIT